jgi:hypothetical protein
MLWSSVIKAARPVVSMLLPPVGPPLLATGMPSSNDRAPCCVPRSGSDCGTSCRTLSPTVGVLLRLRFRLLLGLRLLWRLHLFVRLHRSPSMIF